LQHGTLLTSADGAIAWGLSTNRPFREDCAAKENGFVLSANCFVRAPATKQFAAGQPAPRHGTMTACPLTFGAGMLIACNNGAFSLMARGMGGPYDGADPDGRAGEGAAVSQNCTNLHPKRLIAAAGLALALTAAAAQAAAAREFRAADIQEENYPTVQALRFMDQLVADRTGGRHRIRVFHSRTLGEESQTIEQTRVGAIDMNRINVGAIGNFAPVLNVLALPFLFRSVDHMHKVVEGPIGDQILRSLEPEGFIGLTYYDSGARSIYTATKPVRTLADLKGLRIRVQQSELMEKMIRALGAQPISLAYGQVLTALTTKLVDGAENNWPSFVATGHYKVAPFYTPTLHTMGPEVLVMSRRAWADLSADDRTVFRAAARESSKYMSQQWQDWEERSQREAIAAGVKVISDIDRKPFEDATKPLRDELRADPRFAPLIERIEATR
jgi:tripartite ATP-independent transporter DctP family solute receptor